MTIEEVIQELSEIAKANPGIRVETEVGLIPNIDLLNIPGYTEKTTTILVIS